MRFWRRTAPPVIPGAEIGRPTDETTLDAKSGAVKSRQAADIVIPADAVESFWTPEHLERVARTYWATLERFSLGLVRVHYTPNERTVVLLIPQLPLLTFQAPEYEMDRCRGIVRWRIEKGVLVSARGRGGDGYLEIDIRRHDEPERAKVRLNVAVEVANYYPTLGSRWRWIYVNTQSKIHVVACNFFLRRLVRRDLATSRSGTSAARPHRSRLPTPVRGVGLRQLLVAAKFLLSRRY